MARKKKSSKSSPAKKPAAKSKGKKSDMSTAASASSLDDTLSDATRPGAEPRAAAARRSSIFTNKVEWFVTDYFPEITSATLKNYVKNEEQEQIYRKFRDVAHSFPRDGFPFAAMAITLLLCSVCYHLGIGRAKDGKAEKCLPLWIKAAFAQHVASANDMLQLDPVYAVHNHIESWIGFVSAAFFTAVILRIVISCKRSAKSHIADSRCHLYCVYRFVPAIIMVASICLTAVWLHKLMQLFNYFNSDPSMTIPVQTFISCMYTCQPVYEYSTIVLIVLHRLRIFYHRCHSGVYYASKLGVPVKTWRKFNRLVVLGDIVCLITVLFVAKCYLLLTALFTFLDDCVAMIEICCNWLMSL